MLRRTAKKRPHPHCLWHAHETEEEVLAAIKNLAVGEENTMVAQVTLHNMRQDHDEPIRIRGKAGINKLVTKCTNCEEDLNYTEAILRDLLCRDQNNPEIQLDLLGDKSQDMTIKQVFLVFEAKEA